MFNICDQSQNIYIYNHGKLLGNRKFVFLSLTSIFNCNQYFGNKNYETESETVLRSSILSKFQSQTWLQSLPPVLQLHILPLFSQVEELLEILSLRGDTYH